MKLKRVQFAIPSSLPSNNRGSSAPMINNKIGSVSVGVVGSIVKSGERYLVECFGLNVVLSST